MMKHVLALSLVGLFGCGVSDSYVDDSELDAEATVDAELTRDLKASAGGLTVSIRPVLEARLVGNETRWFLRGSANQDLSAVFSFVPDDGFGEATLTGARTFEVSVDSMSELNTVLSGLRLLVNVTPVGATRALTVGLDVAPRFTGISGSTRLSLTPDVAPVFARGGLTYRGAVRTAVSNLTSVSHGAQFSARTAPGEYAVDFSFEALRSALVDGAAGGRVQFVATQPPSTLRTKTALLVVTVKRVQMTTSDPYDIWPSVTCTDAVKTCLAATPIGATDFGDCGTYREVNRCGLPHQIPALFSSPDDLTALNQALSSVQVPAGKSVSFGAFGLFDNRNVTVELAARGWLQQVGLTGTIGAPLTAGQVNTLLDGWNARALVPAAQRTVLQNAFKAVRVDSVSATGAPEVHVVLLFTTASRVTVFSLR